MDKVDRKVGLYSFVESEVRKDKEKDEKWGKRQHVRLTLTLPHGEGR